MDNSTILRNIPAVNLLLEYFQNELDEFGREKVVQEINAYLSQIRKKILVNALSGIPEKGEIIEEVRRVLKTGEANNLIPVVNATGVILHTNLGRALLSQKAQQALTEVAAGYCNLEIDLESGKRGSRYTHVEELLVQLTNAEAALVVNNNAAAVLLLVNALAKDKEVIVSRGELVEIGGSFRIPEVMKQGGGRLVEVGTTNRTHIRDYKEALTEETAFLLKIHTSNYHILGFTSKPSRKDLVNLAHANGLPVIEDLGSGSMVELSPYGIHDETPVPLIIQQGVDVVAFSGDKLLGGPQAGIIVGKKDIINKLKSNQLTRALRVDKYTLATLEATLREYLYPQRALENIPVLRMLSIPKEELYKKALNLSKILGEIASEELKVEVLEDESKIGGGSTPNHHLPTWVVAVCSTSNSAMQLAEKLRRNKVPIMARVKNHQVLLDMRTIRDNEQEIIVNFFENI